MRFSGPETRAPGAGAGADLVSVILPVFNGMPFLPKAVESIRAQTWPVWELVAVNDGSTDGSGDFLRAAAAADTRVRVFDHPENRGIAAAYNTGLRESRGRYVAFQEQDDVSIRERLERQVAVLRSHDAPIASAMVAYIDAMGRLYAGWPDDLEDDVETTPPGPELPRRILVEHTNIANATMMLDRRRIEASDLVFDEQFRRCCQDADLQIRLALKYGSLRVNEVLVHMRRFGTHPSATSEAEAMVPDLRRLLRKHVGRLGRGGTPWSGLATWLEAWSTQLYFEAGPRQHSWRGWALAILSFLLWPANDRIWQTIRNRIGSARKP